MPRPPDLLTLGARDAILQLQKEELRLGTRLRQGHDARFRSFREQLRRWFLSYFVLKVGPPDEPPTQVWDPLKALRAGLPQQITEQLTQDTAEVEAEDERLFEESLDKAFVTGFKRELWLLTMGGLPGGQYINQLPDAIFRYAAMVAAGVAGLSWLERLRRWQAWHVDRTSRWLASAVIGDQTFEETEFMVRAMERQYAGHVQGLLGNELHRAAGQGAAMALALARQDYSITEVWVTREDALVCPICEALHLMVTDLQPVTDSHPSCRCWKVPVPADYEPTAVTYADFLDALEDL